MFSVLEFRKIFFFTLALWTLYQSTEEIIYTLIKLKEANFIEAIVDKDLSGTIDLYVLSITWSGHQFIDNVRDDKIWKKLITYINSKVDGASIITISKLATEFIWNVLQSN